MENKTKVKVAVVIGIIILAVVFVCMIVFVKGNRNSVNKDIPTIKNGYANSVNQNDIKSHVITLDDVIGFGIENNNLVEINGDYSNTVIKELDDNNLVFCYGDNKIYYSNNQGKIIEIDLLTSAFSEKELLNKSEYGYISDLKYYSGKLYFVTGKKQLIEYSIEESYEKNLTNENEVSCFEINKDKNCVYLSYKPNGENSGIYSLDFTSNEFAQIININDFADNLILNGNSLIVDAKGLGNFYVYNTNSNSIMGIGENNKLENSKNQIAFYNGVILYTNGTSIDLKDENGNNYQENWYKLEDNSIAGIYMLTSNKLEVAKYDENKKIAKSVVIDLSNGTIEENDKVYINVIRIK